MARLKTINENWKSISYTEINKPLLFIIDMVNGFINFGAMHDNDIKYIIPNIKNLAEKSKDIIYINEAHNPDDIEFNEFPEHCLKDSIESNIVIELRPENLKNNQQKNIETVTKCSTNGFNSLCMTKNIDKILKNYDSFIVVGCCTDICVLQFAISLKTYLNEVGLNKDVVVPVDCVDTYDAEDYHDVQKYNEIAFDLMEKSGIKIVNHIDI